MSDRTRRDDDPHQAHPAQVRLGEHVMEIRTICPSCGELLPPWFDDIEQLFDAENNPSYQAWLDSPCATCGLAPRNFAVH